VAGNAGTGGFKLSVAGSQDCRPDLEMAVALYAFMVFDLLRYAVI
jgi:hypothetical protein